MGALRHNQITILAVTWLILCVGYFAFGHYMDRSHTESLLLSYAGLWLMSWPWLRLEQSYQNQASRPWKYDLFAGLFLRLMLLFSWPNLSQDVFRFLWDGALFAQGFSPYDYTPNTLIQELNLHGLIIPNFEQLYSTMGALSAGNFSNYPPVKQLIFALPQWIGLKTIIDQISVLRLLIILGDIGVFFLGRRLLLNQSLNPKYINWYFLNPLIIIELTGNVHFEGIMAVTILTSLLFLTQKKYLYSGIFLSVGVGLKLIPLMFLPLISASIVGHFHPISKVKIKPLLLFITGIFATLGLIFLPLINNENLINYSATTALWFTKFEFNASIYYLLRWLGFQWKGYNMIAQFGPLLSIATTLGILYFSFRVWTQKSNLYQAMLGAILIFLLLSTTVHPWYWTTVLVLSILTQSRIGLLGSALVFLSYTAYGNDPVQEHGLWLSIEYIPLFAFIFWELKNARNTKDQWAKTSSS